jgi:multidrug efflux system membrane fusion protein
MPNQLHKTIVVSVLSATLAACSTDKAAENPAAGGGRGGRGAGGGAVPVTTTLAQSKAVPLTVPAVGTVEPLSTVQIRAQVTGQLSEIHFSEGQEVRKGQPLFTLDPRPFQAALQQAEAVLARDTATAKNAQSQQARYEDLYKRGLIPRDQYETQTATASASQATLAADQAAVETARLNLQYTGIAAPISGRAGALNLHVGDLVRANDTTPLLVINQMSPIYVGFSVPGRYLGDIRRYQAQRPLQVQARIQNSPASSVGPPPPPAPSRGALPNDAGASTDEHPPATAAPTSGAQGAAVLPMETGSVSFIDNTVDATTGTIRLKALFPNTDHALWPGLFVQVTLLLTTSANVIVVPSAAVQESQQGQYVYVVKPDRTAELRTVRVERQQGDEMVIAQGLSAGEEVVTDGHLRLIPGARVTVAGEAGQPGGGRRGGRADGNGRGQGGEGRRGGRTP